MRNYYDVLGVSRSATEADIKSAYRKLAVTLHPDQGGDAASFQALHEAFAVLSDPAARAKYDSTGYVDPNIVAELLRGLGDDVQAARDAWRSKDYAGAVVNGAQGLVSLLRIGCQGLAAIRGPKP